MREYAESGIRHFYFMMLQKEEVSLSSTLFAASLRALSFSFSSLPRRIDLLSLGFRARSGPDLPSSLPSFSSFTPFHLHLALSNILHLFLHPFLFDFASLQYLDATKKGGIGRFANHSCNPNCYVAKWVVGKRMRMGIFAKRDIIKGEELTFNYNVDRYG